MAELVSIRSLFNKMIDSPIIHVDPRDLVNSHSVNKRKGIDLEGDWDKLGNIITDRIIYKSFLKRLSGSDWEDTKLYKQKYEKGERWTKKLAIWNRMIQDIVQNGYVHRPIKNEIDSYISILIGRSGHMFIYNGIHRLCCCLLSEKVDKIPVKVLARHKNWEDFRNSALSYAKRRGSLYCQLPHPDLDHIPHYWTNERAELSASNSLYFGGKVLDVGSHWGTTSYIFSKQGFDVTAVELSTQHYRKLTRISHFPGPGFRTINGDFTGISGNGYDTLLLFNIAHHFVTSEEKLRKLIHFLEHLDVGEVFYQSHKIGDKWSPILTPSAMLTLIMKASGKSNFNTLGTFNGRTLYHIT